MTIVPTPPSTDHAVDPPAPPRGEPPIGGGETEGLKAEIRALQRQLEQQARNLSVAMGASRNAKILAARFDPRFWDVQAQLRRMEPEGPAGAEPAFHPSFINPFRDVLSGLARAAQVSWSRRFSIRRALGDAFVAARRARLRPLRAHVLFQEIRLIRASGLIDPDFYAPQKAQTDIPDVEDARHYVLVGRELAPNRMFSGSTYLRLNPDVRSDPATPLAHFIRCGAIEGRMVGPAPDQSASPLIGLEDRPRYIWPAAETGDPDRLSLADRRPDDEVLAEGRRGREFLDRYGLLSDRPDFAGATEALKRKALAWGGPATLPRPKASIVIPVYGQLAYTLNCLDSLIGHKARADYEILIGDDNSPDESEAYLSRIPHLHYLRQPTNRGFVDNCNATAALARGDFIVLLNNDTRVAPGWLDAMIDTFELFPKAGLVGSKLFYGDGALQEAGGIVWRDGSAWNYGRDDDPNRPRYCYARQVDYVSGAAIAIPTALWNELSGFDEIFRPAYYEDTDIAFRIRAKGLQTWMQPLSRVIHYEGRTSGTDLTQGVKAHQVTNAKTFAARWKATLDAFRPNGHAPTRERERSVTKRVLVIDATTPTPNADAGSVVTVTTMGLYQELGYKVHFAPLHDFYYQPGSTDALHRIGVECAYQPYEPTLDRFLHAHGRSFDLIHVFRVNVAVEALELLRIHAPQAPVIFTNADMHHLRMERQAATENSQALRQEAQGMKVREMALIASVDCTVVHSPVEEDIIRRETPEAEVVVMPYITPVAGSDSGYADRSDIMFLGGYRHEPNVDAALFLANDIWPLVRPQLPSARLLLAGSNPPGALTELASDDVIVPGQVDDLGPYFDRSRVFVASIRYGAGVKGKVTTAMAYGVPVVTTTMGAEGMFLVDGRDVQIADEPAAIAKQIVALYTEPASWNRFSANGLAFVRDNNSLDAGRRALVEAIRGAKDRHCRRTLEIAQEILGDDE